jgi:hypothetical protein
MNATKWFSYLLVTLLFSACQSRLSTSPYARHNRFNYAAEQPAFHFNNEKLQVSDSWHYKSSERVVPKLRYLPDTIQSILLPLSQQHGPVLFAAFFPHQSKFWKEGYVKVSKKDVQKIGALPQLFTAVLVADTPFNARDSRYEPAGRNGPFSFYRSTRLEPIHNRVVYQVIAADSGRYYTYVHIYERSHFSQPGDSAYHTSLALNDVITNFKKKN